MYKMHKNYFLGLAVLLSLGCGATSPSNAQSVPTPVVGTLQQREQHLSHLSFDWEVTVKEHHYPWQVRNAQAMERGVTEQEASWLKTTGTPQTPELQRIAQGAKANLATIFKGGDVSYNDIRHFERDDRSTLVTGETRSFNGFVSTFRQYYQADMAMNVADSIRYNNMAPPLRINPPDPSAWSEPGDSVRYPGPLRQTLGLQPEHFLMLVGLNPLADRGSQWSLTSTTPDGWILETKAAQDGFPINVRMTLSRDHDDAPSDIQIKGIGFTQDFRVRHFRRYQRDWIADAVDYSENSPKFVSVDQTWSLETVEPSQPITVSLPSHVQVHDYRLLGPGLTERMVRSAELNRQHDIVLYQWKGQFPTLAELESFHNQQHPGEATPDPSNKASMLQGSAGLLCLAAGVLLYRRRGSVV